jgi:hypothetical protein
MIKVMQKNTPDNTDKKQENSNKDQQAVDKAPGEERGQAELVTNKDLKGKKVDADPEKESDQPAR